jgi:hypothetical protein
MTTFTTEDRVIAEQNGSVTINVEPIPFAGMVTITEPKYKELTEVQIACIYQQIFSFKPMDVLSYKFALAVLEKAQEK